MVNHNSFDIGVPLSDSPSDAQTNAVSDFDATEHCTLLLQNDERSPQNGILHRIAHYTSRNSRHRQDFCDGDDDDDDDADDDDDDDDGADDNKNGKFFTSSRHSHRKPIKRFLFVFGFVSTLVILSQLCLSLYFYEPDVEGWDRNRTRHTSVYILPNVNTTILQPTTLCTTDQPILLLIVVFSAPGNFEKRQILRETWANTTEFNYSKFEILHAHLNGTYLPINYRNWKDFTMENGNAGIDEVSRLNFRIRIAFLVGKTENNTIQKQIMHESQTHNDLIQENFYDSYNNLTLKSIMMVKWVVNNCEGRVNFVMKCDDDTFVNVPNLIHFLLGGTIPALNATLQFFNNASVRTELPSNRFEFHIDVLIGLLLCHHKPITNYRSKWFTPPYMYDGEVYPNYLSGSGYVFTMDTAKKLYNASLDVPLFHLEDVYLTGLCAEKAGIKPTNFHLFYDLPHEDVCEVVGMITRHEIISSKMRTTYDAIMNANISCLAPQNSTEIYPLKKENKCF